MPELPEVEIITRGLKKELIGLKIKEVIIDGSYQVYPSNEEFINILKNAEVEDIERIAKVTTVQFKNCEARLCFHLAMTGRLLYRKEGYTNDNHLRVKLIFDNGYELRFTDVRMFGWSRLLDNEQIKGLREKYGPQPFDNSLNGKSFLEILKKKRIGVKKALLEQDLIAGVGNIYANDALWMSKIHPETNTHSLTEQETELLLKSLREILNEGIEHGGSTLNDYVDIYGKPGTHQNYFRIYGKQHKPCERCNTSIIFSQVNGRSTFHCPKCQIKKETKPIQKVKKDKASIPLI